MYASAKLGSIVVACQSSFTARSLSVRLIAASTSARARASFESPPYDGAAGLAGTLAPAAGAVAVIGAEVDSAASVTLGLPATATRGANIPQTSTPARNRL